MTKWLETDTNIDIDISTMTIIGSYIADEDSMIIAQIFASQVAGAGNYIFHAGLQIGGIGLNYAMIPKTTAAADVGETAIGAQSSLIAMRNGDILTIYIEGLPGDNTTPDTIVRFFKLANLFPAGAIPFTYIVTDDITHLPIDGVDVWFSTDNPAINIVWKGNTDTFGVARDVYGNLPNLDVGVYFVWRQKTNYLFIDPDTEVISP